MTNREKISEMKVVDFYAKFGCPSYQDFTRFICKGICGANCPCTDECDCSGCYENVDKWLDKECDD